MSSVWSFVCGPHPTLSPSSQVPRALDAARFGHSHTHRHPGGFSIRSTNPSSYQPPVYTAYLSRDPPCVLSIGGGLFWRVPQTCVGWDRMECGHGPAIRQAPLCLWFGYGTMVLVGSHLPTISTLWRHDRGTIALPTLQDKTAIVGTREEDKAVYPTLEALFKTWTKKYCYRTNHLF